MKMIRTITISAFALMLSLNINAQETSRFKTKGFLLGYGKAVNKETDYRIYFLMGDFSWSFRKQPARKFFAAWYAEPQFSPVRTQRPWDLEFGTNLGFRTYWKLNEGIYFYQMIGSGPHFITADVKRQAKGFIFSDNVALGLMKQVNKKGLHINGQLRWRHLSNAGLKRPNSGIDSWNILLGLSWK